MTASQADPKPKTGRGARVLRAFFVVLLLLVGVAVVLYMWASSGDSDECLVAPGELFSNPAAKPVPPLAEGPVRLKVLAFNIGYGRGPAGDESGPWTREHIEQGLDGIAAQIRDLEADLVFLQEVDLGAARSHDIDEGRYLLERSGLGFGTCVVTWEKHYVPFPYWPPSRHYGRMKSGQCILSRYPIRESTRHRLPQPESSPFWRNAFYLHRALDHAKVDVGGRIVDVINVHMEAFDRPNREQHAAMLSALVAPLSDRLIVAGDFNAPPPEAAQKKGFIDEPEADFEGDRTIETIRKLPLGEVLPDVPAFTFPADGPTRRLDYIFFGRALTRISARVLTPPPGPHSDHLPIFAELELR
jgi:endonuclease/exonuclease/phosphatase family metal-dependent hydrolase